MPWLLLIQVVLAVLWYAVDMFSGLPAWLVFLPTIFGVTVWFVAFIFVGLAAAVAAFLD
ncbi:hypothetical protein GGR34_000754 [Microvirga flocculans]|uniref:Uncharacterized protein n=1 Tax=Microvirga flocculans TaxID=217168 RepID=A0A7W6IE13_9HYPH|nr:hypothetical protein [Microvirga flocculans]MBB4039119.1 hypothetical protein [Microvirga flocculans]